MVCCPFIIALVSSQNLLYVLYLGVEVQQKHCLQEVAPCWQQYSQMTEGDQRARSERPEYSGISGCKWQLSPASKHGGASLQHALDSSSFGRPGRRPSLPR